MSEGGLFEAFEGKDQHYNRRRCAGEAEASGREG